MFLNRFKTKFSEEIFNLFILPFFSQIYPNNFLGMTCKTAKKTEISTEVIVTIRQSLFMQKFI